MVSFDELRLLVKYEPDTGRFVWIAPTLGPRKFGAVAGRTNKQGYRQIQIKGRFYQASRLAWILMKGEWPKGQMDHINRNRSDDRFCNLRDVTPSQNNINRCLKNTVLKGTVKLRGKWQAQIGVGNKRIYLGLYDTRDQAHAAYLLAAAQHHRIER